MKSGKGPGGVIGTIQSPQTVLTRSYSKNAVLIWVSYLHKLIEEDSGPKLKHKEESAGRIRSDEDDRQSLRHALSCCIDPLDPSSHPKDSLINIATAIIPPDKVNIDECRNLGRKQLSSFESL